MRIVTGVRRPLSGAVAALLCSSWLLGASPAVAGPKRPPAAGPTLQSVGLDGHAIDRSADPCVDFYDYACGNWNKQTLIPDDESRWYRSFSEITKRNEADLREALDALVAKPPADPLQKKLADFYGACMDEAARNKLDTRPLIPIFGAIGKAKDKQTLLQVWADLGGQGIRLFAPMSIEQDFADATQFLLWIDQGGLGLPDRDDYTKTDAKSVEKRAFYEQHVARMFELTAVPSAQAAALAKEILRIETRLATASKTRVERRDPQGLYNPVGLDGLAKLAPQIDWKKLLGALGVPGVNDGKAPKISVTAPDFVKALGLVWQEESLLNLQVYIRWHVLRAVAGDLSQRLRDEQFALQKFLTGQQTQKALWRQCLDATDDGLGELLAQPYLAKRFSGDSKPVAEQMVAAIGKAFAERVDQLSWMDAETKAKAKDKAQKLAFLIGHPSKWRSYEFAVVRDNHLANVLAASKAEVARNFARLGKPVDREEWYMSPQTVNAYYDPQKNQMVFPAGILQPPFFHASHAVPVNLGGIGMVIGHELTHGFDDEGSQFDALGNLKSWWLAKTREAFDQKTACVVKQFDAFEVEPGVKVQGKLTLGENIADLGGLKLAFAAYRALRKGQPAVVADGFSEDQQFFLSHAQAWCGKTRPELARLRVQTDPHSPARFRVNGPLQNLPEFAAAFQCKAGQPMAPKDRCEIW